MTKYISMILIFNNGMLSSRNCLHCIKRAIVPILQGVKSQKAVTFSFLTD